MSVDMNQKRREAFKLRMQDHVPILADPDVKTAAFNPDQPRCLAGTGETSGRFSNAQFTNCNPQTSQLSGRGLDDREEKLKLALAGDISADRKARLEEEVRLVAAERDRRADPNQPEGDPAAGDTVGDPEANPVEVNDVAVQTEGEPELVSEQQLAAEASAEAEDQMTLSSGRKIKEFLAPRNPDVGELNDEELDELIELIETGQYNGDSTRDLENLKDHRTLRNVDPNIPTVRLTAQSVAQNAQVLIDHAPPLDDEEALDAWIAENFDPTFNAPELEAIKDAAREIKKFQEMDFDDLEELQDSDPRRALRELRRRAEAEYADRQANAAKVDGWNANAAEEVLVSQGVVAAAPVATMFGHVGYQTGSFTNEEAAEIERLYQKVLDGSPEMKALTDRFGHPQIVPFKHLETSGAGAVIGPRSPRGDGTIIMGINELVISDPEMFDMTNETTPVAGTRSRFGSERFISDNSIEGVIRHEMVHWLEKQMSYSNDGAGLIHNSSAFEEIKPTHRELMENVSKYANANTAETVAELGSVFYHPDFDETDWAKGNQSVPAMKYIHEQLLTQGGHYS